MVHDINDLWLIATHIGALAAGWALALLAFKLGQRSDRLSKLIDKAPAIIQGATNIIGSIRDMLESERLSRQRKI